ncbi:hypothetical protein TNCV_3322531 [Trichonephila clavipes]|nr:hypothetical protein TNCV_3322531 [Trichonephila clavipes]
MLCTAGRNAVQSRDRQSGGPQTISSPRENFAGPQKNMKYNFSSDNMLTKYQRIKFIDFCEVWFLPESVAIVAPFVGDHRCHTPRH